MCVYGRRQDTRAKGMSGMLYCPSSNVGIITCTSREELSVTLSRVDGLVMESPRRVL